MCFSFCACCLRLWPNSLRWVFECKTHPSKHQCRLEKKSNKRVRQPSGPLGVYLTTGGIALILNQIMPQFDDIYTPSLQRPETRLCVLGYWIRHAIALASSVASGEPLPDAKDVSQVWLWRAQISVSSVITLIKLYWCLIWHIIILKLSHLLCDAL